MTDGGDAYDVQLSGPAVRARGRLPEKLADAVLELCDGALANPLRVTKPLSGQLNEYRSAHVGIAYRVLVRVDRERRTVDVARTARRALRTAHRADAYRPF